MEHARTPVDRAGAGADDPSALESAPPRWASALPTAYELIERRRPARPGWRPVLAAVLLAGILLQLATNDGGRFLPDVLPALWLALPA
ncbi:MAG: hypothetical protein ACLFUG_05190, partial [Nitriliruptoraceae bacterium]